MSIGVDDFTSLQSVVPVSRETYERLKTYEELLLKWQPKINLIGPDTVHDVWRRHYLDSLQLFKAGIDLSKTSIDMGSGAGFPGMVLAIAGAGEMHLIESDTKKVMFLREVARVTNTKVQIHNTRIEQCSIDSVAQIFSRACTSLSELFSYAQKFVSRETQCYLHKGKNYSKELLDAELDWLFDYSVIPSVTDEHGVIIRVEHLQGRASGGNHERRQKGEDTNP